MTQLLVQLSPKQLKRLMKAVSVIPNLNVFVRLNIKCFTNCKQIPENNVRRSEKLSECQMNTIKIFSTYFSILCIENMHPDKDKVSLPTFLRAEVS